MILIWLQKPVEKRLRTFKQHHAIEDTRTNKIIPEQSAPKETEKSLSKDLLRKVKRIRNLLPVSNCVCKTELSLNLEFDFCVVYFLGFYLDNWKMTMDVLAELLLIPEHLLKGYTEL